MKKALVPLLIAPVLGLAACGDAACDNPGNICTYFGTGEAGLSEDGTCREDAETYLVVDQTVGPDGQLYVLDWNNHRVITFDEDEAAGCETIRTITGTTLLGDGPFDNAKDAAWNHPTNLVFDADGRMIMAAWHNSRVARFDVEADTCEILAGTGARNFAGDGGPAAQAILDLPAGVELDDEGRIYVADQANQRVRRINTDGTIETVIGTGEVGYGGDGGPGTEAMLFNELSQAANPSGKLDFHEGKLYIADTGNHRIRVWDPATGIIDTFAGNGTPGFSGDGGDPKEAALLAPRDVEVGPDGTLYIADTGNHCVRAVKDGVISTVAGVCETEGFDGDKGPASEALLNTPFGLETDADGWLYIADTNNHRIRRVAPAEAE